MKNKVLKQMLAFSLAVALVGGNSVATFAAEPTNGTESSANTQAATDATAEKVAVVNFNIENGKFDNGKNYAQYQLRAGDVQDLPKVTVDDGYESHLRQLNKNKVAESLDFTGVMPLFMFKRMLYGNTTLKFF